MVKKQKDGKVEKTFLFSSSSFIFLDKEEEVRTVCFEVVMETELRYQSFFPAFHTGRFGKCQIVVEIIRCGRLRHLANGEAKKKLFPWFRNKTPFVTAALQWCRMGCLKFAYHGIWERGVHSRPSDLGMLNGGPGSEFTPLPHYPLNTHRKEKAWNKPVFIHDHKTELRISHGMVDLYSYPIVGEIGQLRHFGIN